MEKITVALIGAGGRGLNTFGGYAQSHRHELQFVAVAEPGKERRDKFREIHGIDQAMCFESWEELLDKPRLADAVIIATMDHMHFKPTLKALEKGYHVLLEKPMSNNPKECVIMGEYARKYDRVFSICHVLRYTQFFSVIKKLLDEGRIGRLVSIQHNENVGWWHMAHSFVRGNWRNSDQSSPMILQKSCHDMDIILWLAGADCTKISSFGSLTHFRKENAPEGAPLRCTDGCSVESECPYSAIREYLSEKPRWTANAISLDHSLEARTKALETSPYGRCVYHCDNNVVDHQVVTMEFANEVTAAFTMCGHCSINNRSLKLMGTRGEIRAAMELNEIEIFDFSTKAVETIKLSAAVDGHGGGDAGLMKDFVNLVANDGKVKGKTEASLSVQSHLMAFAAEKSRVSGRVTDMEEYLEELKSVSLQTG